MKRRKASQAKSPLIRLVGLEALAVAAAAGMAGPPAMAAPGDLDPSFGDVGRVGLDVAGQLWSVEVQDDDAILFAAGDLYCTGYYQYSCDEYDFTGRLLADGTPDAGFAVAALASTVVYDSALQADGKLVNLGYVRRPDGARKVQVFRLRPDGSLDQDFGLGGLVVVADATTSTEIGYSVLVEPDGHIVVAGTRGNKLLVARLQANGALDSTFGDGGVYVWGPAPTSGIDGEYAGAPLRVVRTSAGSYRVMAHEGGSIPVGGSFQGCNLHGVTAAGAADAGFGIEGSTGPDYELECKGLAVDAAGRLLLAGTRSGADGEVRRLLASGAVDPAFQAPAVSEQLRAATALTLGATGSIFVGGRDRRGQWGGATVMRLLADGAVDPAYGRAGVSTIDLRSDRAVAPVINDMQALGADALVLAGGGPSFVARLLGNSAGGSPGVLSMAQDRVIATEQGGQAVLKVGRSGGSTGAVAVTYRTRDNDATGGLDYTTSTGRLVWPDGDASEREIVVPIAADTTAEVPEFFEVVLESPEGGAGLGAVGADVEIAGASYPAGDLRLDAGAPSVFEGQRAAFYVNRDFYAQGAVSVTVRVAASSTATPGQDFQWQDVVLTWGDGEAGSKTVEVQTLKDQSPDSNEVLQLELVSPTGGALLSGSSLASTVINDAPKPPSRRNYGGGSFGWLGAMLLGLAGFLRRRLTGQR